LHTSPSLKPPRPLRDLHPFPTRRSSDLRFATHAPLPVPQPDRDRPPAAGAWSSDATQTPPAKRRPFPPARRCPSSGYENDPERTDRKSTRLNSSHQIISYAVFCLKKKKT